VPHQRKPDPPGTVAYPEFQNTPHMPRATRRPGFPHMTQSAPPAPAQLSPGVIAFLAIIRSAELFAPAQLARVEAVVAKTADPDEAARALIAAGLLTRFQGDRLLAGKTDGYHLGPYVILEQIGHGALGRVYKARHRAMNRQVAVKVVAAELTRTASAREAFQNEVRAAAQLSHPNVVAAYDANELAGRFYTVLEFVDGPSFEALVAERGPLPVAEACALVGQAATGLAHAHERGMPHRDIKPTNLLVARPSKAVPDPLVKIADFGIARLSPSPTADYVAPELAHNPATADHRADVYSLGAVLYFLLAGRPPFLGGTAQEKIRRHLWEEPARLESLRPDVPPILAALVHQMLAKYPTHRPASASEVASRLAALAGRDAWHLELPGPHSGAYPYGTGPLSNTYPVPPARLASASDVYPTPTPAPTPSPWEQITEEAEPLDYEETREWFAPARPQRRKAALSGWMVAVMASSMMVLCLLAVGVVVRAMK
jgi:eukaryotic-like serine/threonine-protein kinase